MSRWLLHTGNCVKVAVINRKGGTGKSTVTANLAGELAMRGHNVMIVDTDAQGGAHAAILMGVESRDDLFKALIGVQRPGGDEAAPEYERVPLEKLVQQVPLDSYLAPLVDRQNLPIDTQGDDRLPIGSVYVLSAGANTFRIPYLLNDPDLFSDVLDEAAQKFRLSVLLIDTGPSTGMLDGAIYIAADAFLYVTECERLALVGINDSLDQVERTNKRRKRMRLPESVVLGIVPNKFRSLKEHVENLQNLRDTFGELTWSPMRLLKTYPQMSKYGQTLRSLGPNTQEAFEVVQMVNHFEAGVLAWLQNAHR
jgi:cellulose biosynthesis protein BcsQ